MHADNQYLLTYLLIYIEVLVNVGTFIPTVRPIHVYIYSTYIYVPRLIHFHPICGQLTHSIFLTIIYLFHHMCNFTKYVVSINS